MERDMPTMKVRRLRVQRILHLTVLGLLAAYGAFCGGRQLMALAVRRWPEPSIPEVLEGSVPNSCLPGPERQHGLMNFKLTPADSRVMSGSNDPENERWADIAGNFYADNFIRSFSYENADATAPRVLVRIESEGPTLTGRLEARGLKPNFAYQIKLSGDFNERQSFERIGYTGRWNLPGPGTNYTDSDYRWFHDKERVNAYLFFDFFVTDATGSAVRDFALDSSLHVLWNASRQREPDRLRDTVPIRVKADNPLLYARPKNTSSYERIWAERERARYMQRKDTIRLPVGDYRADLVLTEESFHSAANDGGSWATVMRCPVSFTITKQTTN